jgi:5-methylcytosine-specific restriction enzyme subunit McrC
VTAAEVTLREWETLSPSGRTGAALRGRYLDEAGRSLAATLREGRRLEVRELRDGLEVQTRAYVGRVRLGDLTLTITPKIDPDTLLALFSYAYGLRDVTLHGLAGYALNDRLLEDLVIAMLHQEVERLFQRGLPRRYRARREALANPRGRIDLAALATRCVPEATLPCEHHERTEDWAVHRVLLAGLHLAASITGTPGLRVRLLRLTGLLSERVSTITLHGRAIAETIRGLDRTTRVCEPALRLVEALYDAHSLSLDGAPTGTLPGFLFDMNRFFQALLSRFLRENLTGFEVQDERTLQGFMRYAPDANPRGRGAPRLRPDFTVRDGRRVVALLDAKYRDLWANKLPREILYQLAIYALSEGTGTSATILYPAMDSAARDARVEVYGAHEGWARAAVVLRPVNLRALRDLVLADESAEVTQRRQTYVQRLVFGTT